jgi:hypothetical protein
MNLLVDLSAGRGKSCSTTVVVVCEKTTSKAQHQPDTFGFFFRKSIENTKMYKEETTERQSQITTSFLFRILAKDVRANDVPIHTRALSG